MNHFRVGIVGAGEIGKALAVNAVRGGFAVAAYDKRAAAVADLGSRGVVAASSLAELATSADVVQVVVMDDAQLRAVCEGPAGLLALAKPDPAILVHSTVHPKTVRDLAAQAATRGLCVLDAAITSASGAQGVESGEASFLVGGDAAQLDRLRPLLACSARHIFHLGAVGNGAQAKIIRNFTMYVTLLAAFETRQLAAAVGIERPLLREILTASGATSPTMDQYLSRHEYGAGYRERLPALEEIFAKDLGLALELAEQHGVALPAGAVARKRIAELLAPPDDSDPSVRRA
jgi:3-hydroxyisobutyrate dehydrogenase-like beta-hydroxyacid dehydrogenase